MAVSWQEDFLQKLVEASQVDVRLATARLRPRKLRVSFDHSLMRSVECLFDSDRLTGSSLKQVFVVECVPKRGSVIDEPALRSEFKRAGFTGDFGLDGGQLLFQHQWGVDPQAGFPVHNPPEVRRLCDWTLGVLRLLFDHVERRHRIFRPSRASGNGEASDSTYVAAMEQYLEDLLVRNWESLSWAEELQFVGRQVECGDLGILDILARDRASRDYVVIELKRGKGDDEVVGQLARYMSWIEQHQAAEDDVGVRGAIVAHQITDRLFSAAQMIPGVSLFTYKVAVNVLAASPPASESAQRAEDGQLRLDGDTNQ